MTSLLKESTQGVSSLFREITASSAVSILIKPEQDTEPLPVVSKHVSTGEQAGACAVEQGVRVKGRPAAAKRDASGGPKVPRGMKSMFPSFLVDVCVYFSSAYSLWKGLRALLSCGDDTVGEQTAHREHTEREGV